jgi:hypothetical protein
LRFLLKLLLVFAKILIKKFVFEKNAYFIAGKLAKIAENFDHNIDPWTVPFNKKYFCFSWNKKPLIPT